MARRIYLALLGLHPRRSRDVAASVIRQRTFRAPGVRAATACTDGPQGCAFMLRTIEGPRVRRSVLFQGAAPTLLSFAGLSFAVGRGVGRLPHFLIGAKYRRPLVLPFDRT
jgi:hypothetical protein